MMAFLMPIEGAEVGRDQDNDDVTVKLREVVAAKNNLANSRWLVEAALMRIRKLSWESRLRG